jgi:PAS domain S-box-containing protein
MKILLLEDTKTDAELVIRSLKKVYPEGTIQHAVNLKEVREFLHAGIIFDVALLDMQLPDGNGIDILREIRQNKWDIAVAMLTGSGDEEVAVAALKAGADDYMVKQADYARRLPQTVEFALQHHKEVIQRSSGEIHVLYVEPNPADIDLTRQHLNRYAPFIVLENVPSGEVALQRLPVEKNPAGKRKYDVVLMDYQLPGLNALEFIKILRQERKFDIPILIVTGQGSEEVAVQALKLGASEYLMKRDNYLFRLPSLILSAYQHIELKRKQAALVESEAKYRLLAENSGDVIFTLDFDLNYTYVSPAIKALRGYTPEEVIKRKITDALTPASYKKVKETYEKFLPEIKKGNTSLEPVGVELEMIKKDGTTIWVEVKASVFTDKNGNPTGILGVSRDISKRKEAQKELSKLSRAVTHSPDSIVITNREGKIEYVNPRFTQITGYEREEVLGENPRFLNAGEQPKTYYKKLWDTILAGNEWRGEFKNRKKNGKRYWESASISPLLNESGEITHFVAVKEDITNRKKTEELLKYHANLQQILLTIASKYINIRADELEKSILESLAEMGKFARADRVYIFDYDWDKQIAINTYEWCAEGIEPQIENLQNVPLEEIPDWTKTHRKGNPMFVADVLDLPVDSGLRSVLEPQDIKCLIAIPLMESEKCLGFVGFDWVRNYHSYSEGEQMLLSIFAQMLVNVKTRISLEKTLIIEKDRAEAANRLKTAFLNNISHEVRTPLNGILGFGEILMHPELTEEDKESYFGILSKSSKRLTGTITNFMDASLIVSRNVEVKKKYFDLNKVLQSLYREYEEEAKEKGLEFQLKAANTQENQIHSDPELLRKMLSPLLDNAIKFTEKGKIILGYAFKNEQLELFLKDSGIGIKKEMIDSLCDFFTQGEIGLTRGCEGSGLGLSISKGLAELLGAKMTIDTEKMKGTTVRITLESQRKSDINQSLTKKEPSAGGSIVLIAEDDPVNSLYIQTILTNAGIRSMAVKNGRESVDLCKTNPEIRLVLMDLKMPVMDGLEATRQIKMRNPEMTVIAVTAQAMSGDAQKALEAGCNDYIAKPFKSSELISLIKSYVIKR